MTRRPTTTSLSNSPLFLQNLTHILWQSSCLEDNRVSGLTQLGPLRFVFCTNGHWSTVVFCLSYCADVPLRNYSLTHTHACHCPLTVQHIVIECPALISSCNKHFTASSMKDLFDNVTARNIINFIKESHFYSTVWCCYHIFYISFKPWS